MGKRRVCITGIGVISSIGFNTEDYWNSLKNGETAVDFIDRFDVTEYSTRFGAQIKNFDPAEFGIEAKSAKRMDPFLHYAIAASKEAVEMSGIDISTEDPYRCGVIVGSGIGGMQTIETEHSKLISKGPKRVSPFLVPAMIIDIAAGELAIKYGFKGPNYAIVSACASSAHSIGDSFRMIQYGDADVVISGGSESSITPIGLSGFCSIRALSSRNDEPKKASRPFDADRDGFVMAEGSGIVILEELEHAKKRGAVILAELIGYGATADAYHITAPHPEGDGGANALIKALKDAELNPEELDYFNAHGTSTPYNDKIETAVLKRVLGEETARKLHISSTKSIAGHMLGASGAAELIACVKTINEGVIHPTINYETPDPECDLNYVPNKAVQKDVKVAASNSLGFGGHNAVLIVKKFSD